MDARKDYIFNFEVREDTFHRLYIDFYPSLVVFARKILRNDSADDTTCEAEDFVQDVFIQMWEKRQVLGVIENVKGYLFQSVKNLCLNELRNRKLHREIEESVCKKEELSYEMLYTEQETIRLVYEAVGKLPPKCKEIFIKHLDGLSNREIALDLKIAEETVKKQKKIARKFLKERLGNLLFFLFVLRRKYGFVN